MLKKITVLAMAVGLVAALALPASASAEWLHHDQPIANDVQIGLTGNVRFQGTAGGIECQITSRTKFLVNQTTGVAETFKAHPTNDTTNCKGLGGLAFCQIHNLTPQDAANWQIHTVAPYQSVQTGTKHPGDTYHTTVNGAVEPVAITVTTTTIHSQVTGGFCPVKTISLTPGTVGIIPTPTSGTTVTGGTLNGILTADLTTNSGTVDHENVPTTGTLTVEAPNSGTYSF